VAELFTFEGVPTYLSRNLGSNSENKSATIEQAIRRKPKVTHRHLFCLITSWCLDLESTLYFFIHLYHLSPKNCDLGNIYSFVLICSHLSSHKCRTQIKNKHLGG